MGDEMAGNTKYKNEWLKEHCDRFILVLPKGRKAQVMAYAKSKGMNLAQYIRNLIEKDMSGG
jgi:hypothetical protein